MGSFETPWEHHGYFNTTMIFKDHHDEHHGTLKTTMVKTFNTIQTPWDIKKHHGYFNTTKVNYHWTPFETILVKTGTYEVSIIYKPWEHFVKPFEKDNIYCNKLCCFLHYNSTTPFH